MTREASNRGVVYNAADLGKMDPARLWEIRHCETCLEPWAKCQCKQGRWDRAEREAALAGGAKS